MEKLSDWFPKDVKPVRVGVYQVRREPNGHQVAKWYSHWNGARWGLTAQTPLEAFDASVFSSTEAIREGGFEWRGVLK